MRVKLSRIGLRDLALFVAVVGIVAVAAVFAAREAGLDGPWASAQGSPLTLTLSASDICETTRGGGWEHGTQIVDEDGTELRIEDTYLGHFDVGETPMRWQVSGGVRPYTLEIDGETRDATHDYLGASGTASVSCATTTVESFFFLLDLDTNAETRAYRADPQVDSGWKTVRAVVTDANGDTAEATIDFYVIRTDAEILRRGQTYRVWGGHLVTAPSSYDVALGSPTEVECPEDAPNHYRCEPSFGFLLLPDGHQDDWLTAIAQINLYLSDGTEESRWRKLEDGTWIEITAAVRAASGESDPILAALDEIAGSVNDPPRPHREN